MKKKPGRQNYFRKMLIMYFMVISVTIVVLTSFFYHQYVTAFSAKLYETQQKDLEKSARSMDNLLSEIDQLYKTLILDTKVIHFNSLSEFDPAQNYATYLNVKKYYNLHPYVTSLYIYNDVSKDTITCGSYRFDVEYCWNQLKEQNSAVIIPSLLKENGGEVLTFAYPAYGDSFSELNSGIFISLDMDRVKAHILGTGALYGIVFDKNGQLLLTGEAAKPGVEKDSRDSLYQWAAASSELSGSRLLRTAGGQYLCSYYRYPEKDFVVLSISPYSSLMEPLTRQRDFFLLAAGLIFLSGVFLQYVITRRLYLPIERITRDMTSSRYMPDQEMDEFSLIRHVYEQALNEIEVMEENQAIFLPPLRADLLRQIILHNEDPEQISTMLKKQGWQIPFDGLFLSCFFIENRNDNEPPLPLLQARIQQLVHETIGSQLYTEFVAISFDQVVCFFNTGQTPALTFEQLVDMIENVKETVLAAYPVSLTVSLAGIAHGMEDVSRLYKRCLELRNYRFVLGYNQVIYQKRTIELMPECLTFPDKLASEISSCMIQGNQEQFEQYVGEFQNILKQYAYQPAILLYSRVYFDVLVHLQKTNIPDQEVYLSASLLQMPKTIEQAGSILNHMYEQYQTLRLAAEQSKENKHTEKISAGQRYIGEHFNEVNLSAGSVAEYLGYSTNYFSRLFKSITGFFINDYIRQIRILKAQELLSETDLTINSIAEATGFGSVNYFYSIFKKETGLTPAAYRTVSQQSSIS